MTTTESTISEAHLSISEVSKRTGLSTHTLRFYEDEGLFVEPVRRNAAGRREFSEQEVGWLQVCAKLRASGMPLPDIRTYVELLREGAGNEQQRRQLLVTHQQRVTQQMTNLQEALDTITAKVGIYTQHLAAGTADALWRDGPSCATDDTPSTKQLFNQAREPQDELRNKDHQSDYTEDHQSERDSRRHRSEHRDVSDLRSQQ